MNIARLILTTLVLILILLLGLYNHQLVQLAIFSHNSPPLPLFLVLLLCFAGGFLVASLVSALKISRLRRQLRREQERGTSVSSGAKAGTSHPDASERQTDHSAD